MTNHVHLLMTPDNENSFAKVMRKRLTSDGLVQRVVI